MLPHVPRAPFEAANEAAILTQRRNFCASLLFSYSKRIMPGVLPPGALLGMHTGNSIIMQAPKEAIFETAANLELWPKILPHYRYIRYLERGETRNVVVMVAVRSGIPISWTSEQIIDRQRFEIRFVHMRKWTKGMRVVWHFTETPAGVSVAIDHDLRFRVPALAWLAEPIIGNFIHNIASQTLRCMKAHLEAQHMVAPGK